MEWTECEVSNHITDEFGEYWICDIGVFPNRFYLHFTHPENRDILLGKFETVEAAQKHAEEHAGAR